MLDATFLAVFVVTGTSIVSVALERTDGWRLYKYLPFQTLILIQLGTCKCINALEKKGKGKEESEGLSRRDVNTPVEDSFAGLPEQDYDEEDDEGLAQRDVDASVEDSFAGLPEQDDNEQSV